jgi:hypothetical protein
MLKLEVNKDFTPSQDTFKIGGAVVMVTPDVGEDYWVLRVKLHKNGQAIIGFPKFGVVGVGFAQEDDWNTNLPSSCEAEKIYNHIKCNKGSKSITKAKCLEAIRMIQEAVPTNMKR